MAARLAVVAAFAGACTTAPPLPAPTAPSVQTTAAIAPTTAPSVHVAPTPKLPTETEVFGAVGHWLAAYDSTLGALPRDLYIDTRLTANATDTWFEASLIAELRNAGTPVFGPELSDVAANALERALSAKGVSFVSDPSSVVDANAPEHFGCRPYLAGRAMVHIGAPRPDNGDPTTFYVAMNLDRGCQGTFHLLQLGPVLGGYRVVHEIRQGFWIV